MISMTSLRTRIGWCLIFRFPRKSSSDRRYFVQKYVRKRLFISHKSLQYVIMCYTCVVLLYVRHYCMFTCVLQKSGTFFACLSLFASIPKTYPLPCSNFKLYLKFWSKLVTISVHTFYLTARRVIMFLFKTWPITWVLQSVYKFSFAFPSSMCSHGRLVTCCAIPDDTPK